MGTTVFLNLNVDLGANYRAMHYCKARSCDRMSSVRLSVCDVDEL